MSFISLLASFPCKMDICALMMLFTPLAVLSAKYYRSYEFQIRDALLTNANYSSKVRPAMDSNEPVRIEMTFQISSMLDLNEQGQTFTTAAWVTVSWQDPRLSWNASDFGLIGELPMYVDDIWTPNIHISNAVDSDSLNIVTPDRGIILLESEGNVTLSIPLILSTQCPISIAYFPFDSQVCSFVFLATNQHSGIIQLISEHAKQVTTDGTQQWRINNFTNYDAIVPYQYSSSYLSERNFSVAVFCVFLERDPKNYLLTLLVPSLFLSLIGITTFLAPPDCGERISLSITVVLGLTVFQLLVADILPITGDIAKISLNLYSNFAMNAISVMVSLSNVIITFGDENLSIMKYSSARRLLLHYLPPKLGLLSYNQRVKLLYGHSIREDQNVSAISSVENNGNIVRESKVLDKNLDKVEKRKLKLRTVALLYDRIAFFGFTFMFLVINIKFYIEFIVTNEIPIDNCSGIF